MTTEELLTAERAYADKLMAIMSKIKPRTYDDVTLVAALMLEHEKRRAIVYDSA